MSSTIPHTSTRALPLPLLHLVWLCLLLLSLNPFLPAAAAQAGISDLLQGHLQADSAWPPAGTQRDTLQAFYQQRAFAPLWVGKDGPLPAARVLRKTLANAHLEGLDSRAYGIEAIQRNWRSKEPAALARLELQLSLALLDYGRDVQVGPLPPDIINPLWYIPVADFDGGALLQQLASGADTATTLAALTPPHPEYQRLRSTLAYYRQLAAAGGWPVIPEGPSLAVGDDHPQIVLLRQRLFIEGDLLLDVLNPSSLFDEQLKVAVERFQVRHGLQVDGVVGPATRAAMNVSVALRIEQIKLNMERWRWLPRELGEQHILVNTAGFQLTIVEEGKTVAVMDVIVGRRDRPTPIITGNLYSVVFNPYWTPTPKIIIEDLIPKQLANPGFLASQGIRVYRGNTELNPRTVDWRKVNYNYLPYVLRQDPGPRNAMGQVKFLFNNSFNIYLHDTPQQGLFNRPERTFSSGCIRVSKPVQLATRLLADSGWDSEAVQKAISSKRSQTVALNDPIPVYLLYFTAWTGSDNRAHFRDDVYQLDGTTQACPEPGELFEEIVD